MTMQQAIASAFKNCSVYSGRARRTEYWKFVLFEIELFFVIGAFRIGAKGSAIHQLYEAITQILGTVFFFPRLSLKWRRLHDINKSGFWALFDLLLSYGTVFVLFSEWLYDFVAVTNPDDYGLPMLILIVVFVIWQILFFIWMVKSGQEGPNKYGTDPKARERLINYSKEHVVPQSDNRPEIRFCRKCGNPLEKGSTICRHCGKQI